MKLLWGVGPHFHPLTESSGVVGMPVPPLFWPRGTCQGACWRCWHQGSSSSAIKNMKTQGWSQSPSTCAANSSPTLLPATHFLPLYDCLSHTRTRTHRKMGIYKHKERYRPRIYKHNERHLLFLAGPVTTRRNQMARNSKPQRNTNSS